MMQIVLIAGSYTPVCMIVLGGTAGYTLLAAVWGIAAAGMLIKMLWISVMQILGVMRFFIYS